MEVLVSREDREDAKCAKVIDEFLVLTRSNPDDY